MPTRRKTASLFRGTPLGGENSDFLKRVLAAAQAAGATSINVISGYRDPAHNAAVGGVPGSNHTRGLAMDATVTIPGRGTVPLGQLPTLAQYGLRSGDQPGFYRGGRDPNHVDAGYMAQGVAPTDPRRPAPSAPSAPSAPAPGWAPSALLAYQMAVQRGATPAQAKDFAAVQYGESGFNPQARNTSSGAAGLYQLLSSGYVNRANQLGGVFNPRANIGAILPDYLSYYRSHPTLVPGAAGAAVERSGEGAQYYAQGYQKLPGTPGGQPVAAPLTPAPVAAAGAVPLPAVHTGMDTRAFSNTLLNAMRSGGGLTPAALLTGLRAATAHLRTGAT